MKDAAVYGRELILPIGTFHRMVSPPYERGPALSILPPILYLPCEKPSIEGRLHAPNGEGLAEIIVHSRLQALPFVFLGGITCHGHDRNAIGAAFPQVLFSISLITPVALITIISGDEIR